MWEQEFGPTGTDNGGQYADKSYWICTENWPNQNYPIDTGVYSQIGGFATGYVPTFVVVGSNRKVYYDDNGFNEIALTNAIRLAIDEMTEPGDAALSVSSFEHYTLTDSFVNDSFILSNNGDGDLDYSFSINYSGAAAEGSTWHTNDFNSGLVYINSGTGNWSEYSGGTWNDGTTCANAQNSTTSVMTSGSFSTTGVGDRVWLEFRYGISYQTGASLTAEYYTGSSWESVWVKEETDFGITKVELPVKSENTQIRFTGVMVRVDGVHSVLRLDDIKVFSDDQAYRWLKFAQVNQWGEPVQTGTITSGNNELFDLTFDSTGLIEGGYNAEIEITCTDPIDSPLIIPVQFNIVSSISPSVPENVTIASSNGYIELNWDEAANATSYDIYVSNEPNANFVYFTTVSTNYFTTSLDQDKKFYYVIAINQSK